MTMQPCHRPRKRQLQEIVSEACGLVHHDHDVQRVHVVMSRRPTYRQFRRYRKAALDERVNLSVDRDGVLTIWPAEH